MGLMDTIRTDLNAILTDANGFPIDVIFSTPVGAISPKTVTCKAVAIKHSTAIDQYGAGINSKTARVTVSETALIALGYPVRNSGNAVALKNHLVSFIDITGQTYNAVIIEVIPNDVLGVIVCVLGDKR